MYERIQKSLKTNSVTSKQKASPDFPEQTRPLPNSVLLSLLQQQNEIIFVVVAPTAK
jgi:hypothetical protein